MPLIDWDNYSELLDDLADERNRWTSAATLAEFNERITLNCASLRDGEYGLDPLLAALAAEFVGNDQLVYEQIKLSALATKEQDDDGDDYFVSTRLDGAEVYASSRYAKPADWADLEEADDEDDLEEAQDAGPDVDEAAMRPMTKEKLTTSTRNWRTTRTTKCSTRKPGGYGGSLTASSSTRTQKMSTGSGSGWSTTS